MIHPTLSRRVNGNLAARNDHARYARFFFLAGTQVHEITILLLDALNGSLGFFAEPKAKLARLYYVERIGQPLLQISPTGTDAARRYFAKKVSEGKTKSQALVCLRRHMVTVVYMMLKHNTEYRCPQ